MIIGIPFKSATIFQSEFSAERRTETVFRVTPSNQATVIGEASIISIYPPDAPELTLPVKKSLWSNGRGFSDYLNKITEIAQIEHEIVIATVEGHESRVNPGKWKLHIDMADMLVRKAEFLPDSDASSPLLIISNKGIMHIGSLALPEQVQWTLYVGNVECNSAIVPQSGKPEFDQSLFDTAFSMVSRPYPVNTTITDYRPEPPVTLQTGPKSPSADDFSSIVPFLLKNEKQISGSQPDSEVETEAPIAGTIVSPPPRTFNAWRGRSFQLLALLLFVAAIFVIIFSLKQSRFHKIKDKVES